MEHLAQAIILILGIGVGVCVGIFIGVGRMRRSIEECSVGWLRIDRSEPDEPPKPFLELRGASIETISKKECVVLKVINENYLSRD